MSILTAYAAPDSTPISSGSNLFMIGVLLFVMLVLCIEVYWLGRIRSWSNTLSKKKIALALKEENLSNREVELQQDKTMWEESLGRLVMENETLKEIVEKLAKMKFDSTADATAVSEYLGIFKDLNTGNEHLTQIILYGERRLEIMLQDLLHFKPEAKS